MDSLRTILLLLILPSNYLPGQGINPHAVARYAMQRNLQYSVLILAITSSIFTARHAVAETEISMSPLTCAVGRHYYAVMRLIGPMHLMQLMSRADRTMGKRVAAALIEHTPSLDHPLAQDTAIAINQKKTVTPMLHLWNKIYTYRFLEDESLLQEFTTLLAFILEAAAPKQPQVTRAVQQLRNEPTDDITIESIALRIYLLNRLKSLYTLLKAQKNPALLLQNVTVETHVTVVAHGIRFHHPRVRTCINNMVQTHGITPLLNLFHELQQFRHINDVRLIREFLKLTLVARCTPPQNSSCTLLLLNQLAESQTDLNALSFDAILHLLESTYKANTPQKYTRGEKSPINPDASHPADIIDAEFKLPPSRFANYVYRRYYLIRRLRRAMTLLRQHATNNQDTKQLRTLAAALSHFSLPQKFSHEKIRIAFEAIKKTGTLQPLFTVWKEFVSYQNLENEVFVDEFTQELFIVSRAALISIEENEPTYAQREQRKTLNSMIQLADRCDAIDIIAQRIHKISHRKTHGTKQKERPINPVDELDINIPDLEPFAHIDQVTKRFYLAKRLRLVIDHINRLTAQNKTILFGCEDGADYCVLDGVRFSHERICTCVRWMTATGKMDPLKRLLQDASRYRFIQDEQFGMDLLRLLCVTYRNLHATTRGDLAQGDKVDSNLTEDAIQMYEELTNLSFDQTLNLVDLLTDGIPSFLGKVDFFSDGSWKEWLKKYWWVPPFVIIVGGYKGHKLWKELWGGVNPNNCHYPPCPAQGGPYGRGYPPQPNPPQFPPSNSNAWASDQPPVYSTGEGGYEQWQPDDVSRKKSMRRSSTRKPQRKPSHSHRHMQPPTSTYYGQSRRRKQRGYHSDNPQRNCSWDIAINGVDAAHPSEYSSSESNTSYADGYMHRKSPGRKSPPGPYPSNSD